jgi:hypothetical protein
MDAMNSLDRTPNTPGEYRPILRASQTERAGEDSQKTECCCPELCQLDHSN